MTVALLGLAGGGWIALCAERIPDGRPLCGLPYDRRKWVMRTILGAGFLVFAYEKTGWQPELFRDALFIAFLLLVAYIDYDCGLIFRKVIVLMGVAAVSSHCLYAASLADVTARLADSATGLVGGGGVLLAIARLSGGLGMGDVYFAAALGLWLGWQAILLLLPLAFFMGAVVGIYLLFSGKKRRCDPIPFAPCLSIAAGFVYFYEVELLSLYWQIGI